MAVFATVVLAAFLFEDDDLVVFLVLENGCTDESAGDEGRADFCAAAVAEQHDFFKLDGGTCFTGEQLDFDDIVLLDAVLFSTGFDDCVHSYDRFISIVYRMLHKWLPEGIPLRDMGIYLLSSLCQDIWLYIGQ